MKTRFLQQTINTSLEDTLQAINDFGGVHYWHPYVGTTQILTENNGGL